MNANRRSVAPVRKLVAAVLGTIAVFVMLFGLGMTSWPIVALGAAMLVLAIGLTLVNVVRRGARTWVVGTAHVTAASEPPASSAYGRCELQIVVAAPGLPTSAVKVRDPRVPIAKWPVVGDTLPVMVDVDDMRRVRIQWDEVPTHTEAAMNPTASYPDPLLDDPPADDDLLIEPPEAPPWVTRDRQWGRGPDEPTATPSDLGDDLNDLRSSDPHGADLRSGDLRSGDLRESPVVVREAQGGGGPIVLEGTLVESDTRPGPLPRRPRPSPRPKPRPAAGPDTPSNINTISGTDDPIVTPAGSTPTDSAPAAGAPPAQRSPSSAPAAEPSRDTATDLPLDDLDEATKPKPPPEPDASPPVTSPPDASQPDASRSATSQFVMSQSVMSEPVASHPVTAEPVTAEPDVSEPVVPPAPRSAPGGSQSGGSQSGESQSVPSDDVVPEHGEDVVSERGAAERGAAERPAAMGVMPVAEREATEGRRRSATPWDPPGPAGRPDPSATSRTKAPDPEIDLPLDEDPDRSATPGTETRTDPRAATLRSATPQSATPPSATPQSATPSAATPDVVEQAVYGPDPTYRPTTPEARTTPGPRAAPEAPVSRPAASGPAASAGPEASAEAATYGRHAARDSDPSPDVDDHAPAGTPADGVPGRPASSTARAAAKAAAAAAVGVASVAAATTAPRPRGQATASAPRHEATPDQATSDQATSDQTTSDQTTSDQTTPDQATPDQASSDQASSDQAGVQDDVDEDNRIDGLMTAYPSARSGSAGAIHGVGITVLVTDLDRSIGFYRDMLGFFEIDGGRGSAVLASGDTRLVLRTVHDLSPMTGRLIYLNLEVGDVDAVYDELRGKGVKFVHGPRPVNRGDRLELWAASFHDPDGHNIAITQWRALA